MFEHLSRLNIPRNLASYCAWRHVVNEVLKSLIAKEHMCVFISTIVSHMQMKYQACDLTPEVFHSLCVHGIQFLLVGNQFVVVLVKVLRSLEVFPLLWKITSKSWWRHTMETLSGSSAGPLWEDSTVCMLTWIRYLKTLVTGDLTRHDVFMTSP